jgi:hypothetical protein
MRRWDLVIDVIYDSTNQITAACKVPSAEGNLLPGVCIFTGILRIKKKK